MRIQGEATRNRPRRRAVLVERRGAARDAEAPERVGQRGAYDDDHGDGGRNEVEVGEAHPEDQLVRAVGGDVEHAAQQARAPGPAGHDAVHGVEHEPDEQQSGADEPGAGRPEV